MNYLPSVVAATSNCIKTMLFGEICDNCEGGPIYKLILMAVKLLTIGLVLWPPSALSWWVCNI
ncbi:MAG: hypothetical protein Q4D22_03950 [Candidatus Saccharibacteria bacterium]|nr:hypothetical protein [Candidatus Saccharibacteria bacterium]